VLDIAIDDVFRWHQMNSYRHGLLKAAYAIDELVEVLSLGRNLIFELLKNGDLTRIKTANAPSSLPNLLRIFSTARSPKTSPRSQPVRRMRNGRIWLRFARQL
jgi:hypothetical protein